jgi:N-methylhydantoinase B
MSTATTGTSAEESAIFRSARDIEDEYGIDIATAETIRWGLIEATRHMSSALQRSSFSNTSREILDMAVGIHMISDEGTELVAVTEGCTHFAFTQQHMTNMVIDEWGLDNLGPGDALFSNDSFRGSIHFSDVNLFRPFFWEGEPLFIFTDAAHVLDSGGGVQGGFYDLAETYFQEGIRVPPTLILSGDQPVRSTINLLLENARTPMQNLGDFRALFGTLKIGDERMTRLLERYGVEQVKAATRYALDLAERRIRRAIVSIPDGTYEAEEHMDDDGTGGDPVLIRASARVHGDSVEMDYSGSSRQSQGAHTTCWEEMNRCLIGPKMMLDPNHPMNAGAMRPFHVTAPPGSVVMGLPPTSQSGHNEIATKATSLMVNLFGQMLPDRAIATDSGTSGVNGIGGIDNRAGRKGLPFGGIMAAGGAWGGTPWNDGISFNLSPIFNLQDNIIELFERDNPVLIRSRNLMIDSAGVGEHRSGFSNCSQLEVLPDQDTVFLTLMRDSGRFLREGMGGGGAAMPAYLYKVERREDGTIRSWNGVVPLSDLEPLVGIFDENGAPDPEDGTWQTPTDVKSHKLSGYAIHGGEVWYTINPTGAGYGDPLKRDPDLVRLDVWNEKITPGFAARAYGVAVDAEGSAVDDKETETLRKELDRKREAGEWSPPVAVYRPWPATWDDLAEVTSERS